MGLIFLSYRRGDAEGQAGRLYDDLVEVFGSESVFMDVKDIGPGQDFREVIHRNLYSCTVFLALMGRGWLDAIDGAGSRQSDNLADFVVVETGAALKRGIPVIPVLVQGAQMPKEHQLPVELKDLAYRNAIELTHPRWDSDLQYLINALRSYVASVNAGDPLHGGSHGAIAQPRPALLRPPGPSVTPEPPSLPIAFKDKKGRKWALAAVTIIVGLGGMVWLSIQNGLDSPVTESAATAVPAANAPAQKHRLRPYDISLAAERGLTKGPKRYLFTLWVKAPDEVTGDVSQVHYDLVSDSTSMSVDGTSFPPFSAVYEGSGCYETVVLTVNFKTPGLQPFKKTFNMCNALK